MRIFIAFDISDKAKDDIVNLIDHLNSWFPKGIKWVPKENLHITCQFVGNIKAKDIWLLDEFIEEKTLDLFEFLITDAKIEIVPTVNPKTIWLRFNTENKQIFSLHRKIRKFLQEYGYDLDNKKFKIHITLGRIKSQINPKKINEIEKFALKHNKYKIKTMTLYKSTLYPDGPVYESLAKYKLNSI